MRWRLGYLPFLLLAFSVPLQAQIEPISTLKVQPIPLPGGDIVPPTVLPDGTVVPSYGLFNQFFPGPPNTPSFDPMNADPQGITNFHGVTAMGYTRASRPTRSSPLSRTSAYTKGTTSEGK